LKNPSKYYPVERSKGKMKERGGWRVNVYAPLERKVLKNFFTAFIHSDMQ
jgi:hypothetical protein